MTAPLAFIDTETTGVHPGRRAWEVAIIRREPDGETKEWLAQITDVDLSDADPFGLKVGRFYERHVSTCDQDVFELGKREVRVRRTRDLPVAYPEAQVARHIEQLTRGAHLVGAVPNFDAEVFADMLRRHKLAPAWHYHLIDVEALAVGYLHGRRRATDVLDVPLPWKSDELSLAVGVEPATGDERHTALGDARWAMRLYDAVTAHDRPDTPHRP